MMNCQACDNSLETLYTGIKTIIPTYICTSCNLTQVETTKLDGIEEHYEKTFWEDGDYKDYIGTDFTDKKVQDLVLNWKSWYAFFKKYFSNKKTILDIGSGTGISLIMFEEEGFEVTGIEPDQRNVDMINKKLVRGICLYGFFEEIKLDKKFEIIWASHSFEHVKNPNIFLKKCYDLLDDDGVLCITVPDGDSPSMLKLSVNNSTHLYHYSKKSLGILGQKNGFNVLSCNSIALMSRNVFRLHKLMKKFKLTALSEKFAPLYPFYITHKNNGYEIRIAYKNKK